jgi:3-hydroxybutyryl-CoA dehydratase
VSASAAAEAGGAIPVTPRELFGRAFDDILVGHEFRTPGRTITEADVVSFSAWTGDRNPMHTDAHWSEEHGIFGQRIAHGMLILSYAIGLIPLDPERVIALRRIRDVVFKRPVMLGDCSGGPASAPS